MANNKGNRPLSIPDSKRWLCVNFNVHDESKAQLLCFDEHWRQQIGFRLTSAELSITGYVQARPNKLPKLYFDEITEKLVSLSSISIQKQILIEMTRCLFSFYNEVYRAQVVKEFEISFIATSNLGFMAMFDPWAKDGKLSFPTVSTLLSISKVEVPEYSDLDTKALYETFYQGTICSVKALIDLPFSQREVMIILFCAIDYLAWLSLPPSATKVQSWHFFDWCDRYLRLVPFGLSRATPLDVYMARCSYVHTYGGDPQPNSKYSFGITPRQKDVDSIADVLIADDPPLMIFVTHNFAARVIEALTDFLAHASVDKTLRKSINQRLEMLPRPFPLNTL